MLNAVILAGGRGERFWPRSRTSKPKQLLALTGTETMLQMTVNRILPLIPIERVYIVTGAGIEQEIREQLPDLPSNNVIVEPVGRNTAAAIGLSAVWIRRFDENPTMVVLPADHLVFDENKFLDCLSTAVRLAREENKLVVFGIVPDSPEGGYGYIQAGESIEERVFQVRRFVEKPDAESARHFVESGDYYWNSGMFVWTYRAIMEAVEKYMPELFRGLGKLGKDPCKETISEVYEGLEDVSVDYGIMEKTSEVVMLTGDFGWDDVGSWIAMGRIWEKDDSDNVHRGDFVGIDTHNSIIAGDSGLVSTIGVRDMIVVATADAVLVCPKSRAGEIRDIVRKLRKMGKDAYV